MRSSISIGTGAAVAAVFTHGAVFSAANFREPLPVSTYQGFFQQMMLSTERLWSYAHGWQPMSHIRDFGWFYAPAVQLICPLLGFALFWILSRHKMDTHIWKPLAIAFLLSIPTGFVGLLSAGALPWVEAARTLLLVLLMVWSAGAMRTSIRYTAIGSSVTDDSPPLAETSYRG
jgi:hypothetical protein